MISREEAKQLMSMRHRYTNKSVNDVIDDIYNSIGSCETCGLRGKLQCNKLETEDNGYCDDYIKKEKRWVNPLNYMK